MPSIKFECRYAHAFTEKVERGITRIRCPQCLTFRGVGTLARATYIPPYIPLTPVERINASLKT